MRFALFREVPKRQRRKKRKLNSGAAVRKGSDDSDDDDEDDGSDEEEPPTEERMKSPVRVTRTTPAARPPQDPIWGDDSQDASMAIDEPSAATAVGPTSDGTTAPER